MIIRNKISTIRAGGPRQFGEIRNRYIVRVDSKENIDDVTSEIDKFELEFNRLDNAPILTLRPRFSLEAVFDSLDVTTSSAKELMEKIRDARKGEENIIDATANSLEITKEVLSSIESVPNIDAAEFVKTKADYGPENLRFNIREQDSLSTSEAESAEGNLGRLYSTYNVDSLWERGIRGENAIACTFDTAYSEDLIDKSRIVATYHDETTDSVFESSEGHGTMCIGAMAANKSEDVPFNGAAPDAGVILVRITDSDGQIRSDIITEAWDWLTSLDVDRPIVSNHSYGTPLCSGRPRSEFCGTAVNDIVSIATSNSELSAVYAAGNEAMYCFPEGTQIATTKRQKNIEDVKIGDHVLTHTGDIERVTDTMCRRTDDDMITIRPYYGEEIICTADHPILVKNKSSIFGDDKTEWKEAQDITEDDKLVVPRAEKDERVPESIDVPDYSYDGQAEKYNKVMAIRNESGAGPKEIHDKTGVPIGTIQSWIYGDVTPREVMELPDEVEIDEELAKLIGYYVAEGSADKNRISFGLHKDEKEIIEEITSIVHQKFNNDIEIKVNRNEGKSITVQVNCTPLSEFLRDLCGNGSENKKFPNWGLYHRDEVLKSMLEAYYEGDGWSDNPSRHSISTQSEELAHQVKLMMARLGAVTGISRTEGGDKSKIYGREVERNDDRFRVYSSKGVTSISVMEDVTKVTATDGASDEVQPTNAEVEDNHIFVDVDTVESGKECDYVYNIEVENNHSYIANGIAVHNCGHRPSGITNAITGTNSIPDVFTVGAMLTNGREAQRYSSHGRGDCAPIADPKPNVAFPLPKVTYYGGEDGWKLKDLSTGPFGSGGGTSHASPSTAGIITLMQSKAVSDSASLPDDSSEVAVEATGEPMQDEEIKQILHDTSTMPHRNQINSLSLFFSEAGYDARFGHGRVVPEKALSEV